MHHRDYLPHPPRGGGGGWCPGHPALLPGPPPASACTIGAAATSAPKIARAAMSRFTLDIVFPLFVFPAADHIGAGRGARPGGRGPISPRMDRGREARASSLGIHTAFHIPHPVDSQIPTSEGGWGSHK